MNSTVFGLKSIVVGLIIIMVIGSLYLLATSTVGAANSWLGLAIIWVALLPSLLYFQGIDQPPIPFLPLTGVFYAVFLASRFF